MKWHLSVMLMSWMMTSHAAVIRFEMKDAGLRNLVHFVSDAPLEKTVGISNFISGWVELDPEKLASGVKGEFEVDSRTFQTGIDSRNEQIRENFLSAFDYPLVTFTITRGLSFSKPKLLDGQPVSVRLEGQLKAKGVVKSQVILAKVVYIKESELSKSRLGGNLLKVSASFDMDLAGFGIQLPDSLKYRFSRFIQVYVDAIGSDSLPVLVKSAVQ